MNGINETNGNRVGAEMLAYLRGEKDLFRERAMIKELKKQEKTGLWGWLRNPQKRRVQRLWAMVELLVEDGRMTLSDVARKLDLPVSTAFDMMREVERYFRFTIVLKDEEKAVLASSAPARFEFAYEIAETAEKAEEVPLSIYAEATKRS